MFVGSAVLAQAAAASAGAVMEVDVTLSFDHGVLGPASRLLARVAYLLSEPQTL